MTPCLTLSKRFAACTALSLFAVAVAFGAPIKFDIPAQPAPAALKLFTKQSGTQVMFVADVLKDVTCNALSGEFEPSIALGILLKNTGYTATEQKEGYFAVVREKTPNAATGSVKGVLVWPEGQPAEGVLVFVQDSLESTQTDHYGQFGFTSLPPGTYLLVARSEGYQPMHITDVKVSANQELTLSKLSMRKADEVTKLEPYVVEAEGVTKLENYEVEGTRAKPFTGANVDIPRTINDVQPYYIMDSRTIEQSGALNVEDFLKQRLTMNTTFSTNSQANGAGISNGTTSSINLRGLGTNETLILVNGRRMAGVTFQFTSNQPDVNGIPLAAIDRIEVLPSSASGIYGGSAMGGVINIILKRDYQGGDITYSYKNTFDADAPIKTTDATYGFSLEGGKTTVMLTAHYQDAKPLVLGDRKDIYNQYLGTILANQPSLIYSSSIPRPGATTNIVGRPNGTQLILKNGTPINSNITFIPSGTSPTTDQATLDAGLVANAGKFNTDLSTGVGAYGLQAPLGFTPLTKSFMASVHRQMTPWLDAFVDFSTMTNKGSGSFGPAVASIAITGIPASAAVNPFNNTVNVSYPTTDTTPAIADSVSRIITAGLVAKLPHEWNAELDFTWSKNNFTNSVYGVDPLGLRAGIVAGTVNPFVDTIKYPIDLHPYYFIQDYSGSTTLNDLALRASGPVWNFSWGSPTLTIGLEHRREGFPANVLTYTEPYQPLNNDATFNFGQAQTVNSVYGELNIPLLGKSSRKPGLRALELQVTNRSEFYSVQTGTTGAQYHGNPLVLVGYNSPGPDGLPYRTTTHYTDTTQTIGLKYQPVDDLTFRVSFATAFLPPNYNDLLGNPTVHSQGDYVTDPLHPDAGLYPVDTTQGGNPSLKPEHDKNWDIGAIFEPKEGVLKGLRLDLEYYDITQLDAITYLYGQQFVDTPGFAGRITRDPTSGLITRIDESAVNANKYETQGWDLSVNFRKTTEYGTFEFYAMGTVIAHEKRQLLIDSPLLDYVNYPDSGGEVKSKANGTLTWQKNNWLLGWTTTWYSSYRERGADGDPTQTTTLFTTAQGASSIPAQAYHQVFVSYQFGKRKVSENGGNLSRWSSWLLSNLTLQVAVNDVFNKAPPMDVGFAPYFYSPLGDIRMRSYSLQIKKAF